MGERISADVARKMMTGTTPGPWEAYRPAEIPGTYRIGSRPGRYVGLLYASAGVPGVSLSRSHPNEPDPLARDARLMAAAPALAATVVALEAERDAAVAEVEKLRASVAVLRRLVSEDNAALGDALGAGPQDIDQAVEAIRDLRSRFRDVTYAIAAYADEAREANSRAADARAEVERLREELATESRRLDDARRQREHTRDERDDARAEVERLRALIEGGDR